MKKGDIIDCANEKDLERMLRDLGLAGFLAARDQCFGQYALRIMDVPYTRYMVQARDQNGRCQKAYCDTLEEAGEIATEYENCYEFVEILRGYPGEWENIAQSW